MNNDIAIRPAYLGGPPVEAAFSDHSELALPPRISMIDDRFNPIDENGNQVLPPSLSLDVILLWENDTRVYFPLDGKGNSTYEPDSSVPPTCFSDNRVTPSLGAQQPQSKLCANCPRAVRDIPSFSGKTMVSACKNRYKVACLAAAGRVFLLSVGPASRRPYEQYLRLLKAHHAAPYEVVTRLDYRAKAFEFSFSSWLDERQAKFVRDKLQTDEPALVVNAFDEPQGDAGSPLQTALQPRPQVVAAKTNQPPDPPDQFSRYEVRHEVPLAKNVDPATGDEILPPTVKRRGRPPGSRNAPKTTEDVSQNVVTDAETPSDDLQARLREAFGRTP